MTNTRLRAMATRALFFCAVVWLTWAGRSQPRGVHGQRRGVDRRPICQPDPTNSDGGSPTPAPSDSGNLGAPQPFDEQALRVLWVQQNFAFMGFSEGSLLRAEYALAIDADRLVAARALLAAVSTGSCGSSPGSIDEILSPGLRRRDLYVLVLADLCSIGVVPCRRNELIDREALAREVIEEARRRLDAVRFSGR